MMIGRPRAMSRAFRAKRCAVRAIESRSVGTRSRSWPITYFLPSPSARITMSPFTTRPLLPNEGGRTVLHAWRGFEAGRAHQIRSAKVRSVRRK